jgi:excisionase family DNA binding protein
MVRRKELPGFRVGKHVHIRRADLLAWIKAQKESAYIF